MRVAWPGLPRTSLQAFISRIETLLSRFPARPDHRHRARDHCTRAPTGTFVESRNSAARIVLTLSAFHSYGRSRPMSEISSNPL